jgi:hypothetical protein
MHVFMSSTTNLVFGMFVLSINAKKYIYIYIYIICMFSYILQLIWHFACFFKYKCNTRFFDAFDYNPSIVKPLSYLILLFAHPFVDGKL